MKAHDNGRYFSVTISSDEVHAFMDRWPCSGLTGNPILAQFDKSNGDLVDLRHNKKDCDGDAMMALVRDGQNYAARRLKLPWICRRTD